MKRNIVDKIWQQHAIPTASGHPDILAIDFTLLHEVTSAQAFAELKERQLTVNRPDRCLATIDHSIPTRPDRHRVDDPKAIQQMQTLKRHCQEQGIPFHDIDSGHQGIVHVMGPELGITQPGMTLVCGDSHTATHGAFGALAFGIGTSTLSHVLATGALLMHKPKVMQVGFSGQLPAHCEAKDLILRLIKELGVGGANGHVIEYTGSAIQSLSMEARMTLCNMSIECGAMAGLISPDTTTLSYLKGRPHAPGDSEACHQWLQWASDADCHYDRVLRFDVSDWQPMVTWGTNPAQATATHEWVPDAQHPSDQAALTYTQLKPQQAIQDITIDWAFVGSCTNGRIEDLRTVASILQNQRVAGHVTMYIVPGSEQVHRQAVAEGLDQVFRNAGADFRLPGCSMCLAMNDDVVPAGARCISTTNRNFIGRQGTGSITHLASPTTVAHSAIAGHIKSGVNP